MENDASSVSEWKGFGGRLDSPNLVRSHATGTPRHATGRGIIWLQKEGMERIGDLILRISIHDASAVYKWRTPISIATGGREGDGTGPILSRFSNHVC